MISDNEREDLIFKYVFYAIAFAFFSFFLLDLAFKLLIIVVKLGLRYWWAVIIVVLLLLFFRKKGGKK